MSMELETRLTEQEMMSAVANLLSQKFGPGVRIQVHNIAVDRGNQREPEDEPYKISFEILPKLVTETARGSSSSSLSKRYDK